MMKRVSVILKIFLIGLLAIGASGLLYWGGVMPVTAWLVLLNTLLVGMVLFFAGQFMLSKGSLEQKNRDRL